MPVQVRHDHDATAFIRDAAPRVAEAANGHDELGRTMNRQRKVMRERWRTTPHHSHTARGGAVRDVDDTSHHAALVSRCQILLFVIDIWEQSTNIYMCIT